MYAWCPSILYAMRSICLHTSQVGERRRARLSCFMYTCHILYVRQRHTRNIVECVCACGSMCARLAIIFGAQNTHPHAHSIVLNARPETMRKRIIISIISSIAEHRCCCRTPSERRRRRCRLHRHQRRWHRAGGLLVYLRRGYWRTRTARTQK